MLSTKKHTLVLFITLLYFFDYSQGFKKFYYKPNSVDNISQDVIMAPNGNIVLIGITSDTLNNISFNHLTLNGSDGQGNFLWRKSYGSNKLQYANNALITRFGLLKKVNCFYSAITALDSNNKWLSVLIKFNYNGDTLWQKPFYSGTNNVNLYFQGMNKSVDGGLLITGIYEDFNISQRSILILKTDTNGNELWKKKIISTNVNPAWSTGEIIQDSLTKKIILCGYQYLGPNVTHSLIMLTDSLGNKLNTFDYSDLIYGGGFNDLIQTKDKNFVGVGFNKNPVIVSGSNSMKALMVKFDISGNVIWKREYDTTAKINGFQTINEMPSGDLILSQEIDTLNTYGICCLNTFTKIYRTDLFGNIKWKKSFDFAQSNSNQDIVNSVNFANDGNILATVWLAFTPQPNPYILIKLDTTGCDSTTTYCIATGINEQFLTKNQVMVYPSPTTNFINVEVDFFVKNSQVKILNVLGEEVTTQALNENKSQIDVSSMPVGIYFLILEKNKRIFYSQKFIKQ